MTWWLAAAALSFLPCRAQQFGSPPAYPAAKQGGQYMHNYYIPPAPSSSPWAPAWAPDGRSVAVSWLGSIWSVDLDSGKARELTYGPAYHSSPEWSPDGKWLVYTADNDGQSVQLEVLHSATGQSHPLTSGNEIHLDPAFSPDGRLLAYVSTEPSGYFNIYIRPFQDGRWTGPPVRLTQDNRYPRDRLYFGPWDLHITPAWTPDGKELLYVSNRGVALGSGHLWRMPLGPDGAARSTAILQEQSLYRTRPDVSPDGKRVLYSSTAGAADQFNHLYVVPIQGGAPYKLTFGEFDHFHPRWSPDGEWIAFIHNRDGLPQLGLLETHGGLRRDIPIRETIWRRPMGSIDVRIIDDVTGRLTPARIHGLAADGKFYPPPDAYSRLGRGSLHAFHAQGHFTTHVPPGEMTIQAVKGFGWIPAAATVRVAAGRTTSLTLRLRRLEDAHQPGWFSGSTHVHMNYGGNLRNTPENLVRMARAEGLDVVMNLVANKDNRVLDHQFFVPGGGEHPHTRGYPDAKLHMGEEYRPPFYGHTFFLGLQSHLISPFTTGYEGTAIESLYPSNTDMLRKAKAQGAVTGYVHAFHGDADPIDSDLGVGKGFPVDAALGTADCLEWSGSSRASLRVWHHALNLDLPVTPTGGEDSISSLHRTKLVGSVRTYALSGALDIRAWIEAVRRGRTYFSTGPLLRFHINGKAPGESLQVEPGGELRIEASAVSIAPLSKAILYRNGAVFRELPLSADRLRMNFAERARSSGSAWYSLYVEGPPFPLLDAEYPQAATNAIRVYSGRQRIRNAESARYFIRWIDRLEAMAKEWLWWRSPAEKDHVLRQFDQARRVYQRLLAEAE